MLKRVTTVALTALLALPVAAFAQDAKQTTLRKFIIERDLPKVGSLPPDQLKGAAGGYGFMPITITARQLETLVDSDSPLERDHAIGRLSIRPAASQ